MKNQKYHVEFDIDFKRNSHRGLFVVLEGIEASGKTTQTERLGKKISEKLNVLLTKNPTDSYVGQFIRKSLLAGKVRMPPVAIQYLFGADREIQQEEINEHLEKGEVVVSDRYFWSSVAYGIADKKEFDYENSAELSLVAFSLLSMYHQFILPDITIYLEVPVEEAMKRITGSKKHTEIYDNEEMNVRVEKGYKWLIKKFPKEFIILDGTKSEETLETEILKIINSKLKNK
ncbi:MAG TPA: dTMP kinase [Patescibacteria group bacterium]|nr:dTMP kinase [Patescibacteria group bacterium]